MFHLRPLPQNPPQTYSKPAGPSAALFIFLTTPTSGLNWGGDDDGFCLVKSKFNWLRLELYLTRQAEKTSLQQHQVWQNNTVSALASLPSSLAPVISERCCSHLTVIIGWQKYPALDWGGNTKRRALSLISCLLSLTRSTCTADLTMLLAAEFTAFKPGLHLNTSPAAGAQTPQRDDWRKLIKVMSCSQSTLLWALL